MKNVKLNKISGMILLAATISFGGSKIEAISAAEKATDKRKEIMEAFFFLEVPIANFGSQEQKDKYEEFKAMYTKALSLYYEENYVESYKQYLQIEEELEKSLEVLSAQYIERTERMLSEVLNDVVDVNVKFNARSDFAQRTKKDREVKTQPRQYNHLDYHFTYDRRSIYNSLDYGYKDLRDAKKIRQGAIDIEKHLEEGQKITPRHRKERIEKYMVAIKLCREGKTKVINIYQLKNRNDIYSVQTQYRENPYLLEKKLEPVFDTRIPDQYKVDANDNYSRIHQVEVDVKLEGKDFSSYGKKENKKTTASTNRKPAPTQNKK
ncbi:MAG: hypothetical protein OEZ13_09390 [Spirochaetia bacterium]|nr:hypothetical protein [Spirochaetia bacterium]